MAGETSDHPPTATPEGSTTSDASLREDVSTLAREAKQFAQAELAYQKARAGYAAGKSKDIAILGAGVIFFVFFALMAAVVGTVIALGPILGLWGAMAAVTAVLALLAAVCGFLALSQYKRMKAVISDGGDNGDNC